MLPSRLSPLRTPHRPSPRSVLALAGNPFDDQVVLATVVTNDARFPAPDLFHLQTIRPCSTAFRAMHSTYQIRLDAAVHLEDHPDEELRLTAPPKVTPGVVRERDSATSEIGRPASPAFQD
jgi:hypothetical protein